MLGSGWLSSRRVRARISEDSVTPDPKHAFGRHDPAQARPDGLIVLVRGQLFHVVEANQDRIDVVLLQPLQHVPDRGLEFFDRNLCKGVVGADLPKDHVGVIERHLDLEAFGGGGGQFAGDASIDDLDVQALDGAFENLLKQRHRIARAAEH